MKWILGVDLRPRSQGALAFARWLHEHGGDAFVPVHVVPEDHLQAALRYKHLDEVMAEAQRAADRVVETAGVTDLLGQPRLVRAVHVESALAEQLREEKADGLVVGRQATREGRSLVHLGKIARRLLRDAPGPVVVVPPDMKAADVGKGPILALTRLNDHSVRAVGMAIELGKRWKRPVHLAHIMPLPQDWGSHYLPGVVLDEIEAEHAREGAERMEAWCEEHGFDVDGRQIVHGSVLDEGPKLAHDLDACLVVTGSRRLSTGERWLLTSVSSHVAALADRPVMVVPPAEG